MKDANQKFELGHQFVAETYTERVQFSQSQAVHCFVSGFTQGYEEGLTDARDLVPILDIIAIAKSLRANSKKVGLYFCSEIDLTSGRMTAVIYDMDENGRLNNRVWEGNPGYRSDNLADSANILSEADAFLCKYGEESVENLTAEIERLSAKLKEKKQKLATVKKAVKKETEK